MRWLHSLSFSSSNSSSSYATSSSSYSCSNCSSSSASASSSSSTDATFCRQSNTKSHRSTLAFRFGGGSRFSRQKKLSFLNEQDVSIQRSSTNATVEKSPSEISDAVLTRSPSSSSVAPSRLSTSVPLPLPLPLPVQCGEVDPRFSSPREMERDGQKQKEKEKERDKERTNGESMATGDRGSSASPISRERRKMVEHLEIKSPNKMQSEFYLDNYIENRASPPTKSAPSSPFSSPLFSPQILTPADLLPYYQMITKGNNGWSAPEMATVDIAGLPPPAFFDYTAFSTDTSPLHSPPNRSPRNLNPRSPTGIASPLTTRLSVDGSSTGRDGNANIEVHPLPLPPGAAKTSPTTPVPQVITKPDSVCLKSKWQKGKLIGRGTFGSVYVASNRETGALCAMKEVDIFPDDPKSAESIKQLEQEIKVLSQLKHPNIVQYYGSEIVDDQFNIYLEYVHPGSINKYAREHCGAITENVVRSFTRHILSGLAYLHSMKTTHRDIKGANLLVDASGVVKLADFGMSKLITGQVAELSLKGSPYWMAPELMQAVMQKDTNSNLALAVDIWSLGCTIIEMFTGKPPWSDFEGAAAMFKVLKDTPPIPESLSPEGKDFLSHCFKRNPAERASASMLLEHRWLRNLQQLDVPSSTLPVNGMKLTDNGVTSEVKLDQIHSPINAKGMVVPDCFRHSSYTSARVSDIILARLST